MFCFLQNLKSFLLFQVSTLQPAFKQTDESLPFVIILTFLRSSLYSPQHTDVHSKWRSRMATNVKCNSNSFRQSTKRAKLLKISFSSSLPFPGLHPLCYWNQHHWKQHLLLLPGTQHCLCKRESNCKCVSVNENVNVGLCKCETHK